LTLKGSLQHNKGPASVFGFQQLAWTIDSDGMWSLATFLKFPILTISHKRLIRFATQAWMQSVLVVRKQRFSLLGFPDMTLNDQSRLLCLF